MANDWKCWVEGCNEMHTEDSMLCTEHLDSHLEGLREMEEDN